MYKNLYFEGNVIILSSLVHHRDHVDLVFVQALMSSIDSYWINCFAIIIIPLNQLMSGNIAKYY
jgi:hypothetical protein